MADLPASQDAVTYAEILKYVISAGGGALVGGLFSYFLIPKKDRRDNARKAFDSAERIMENLEKSYQDFCETLTSYTSRSEPADITQFRAISRSGETYIRHLKVASNAVLTGHVETGARDTIIVPHILEAVNRVLPLYYRTLSAIAEDCRIFYDGVFSRKNYEALYAVVDKYAGRNEPAGFTADDTYIGPQTNGGEIVIITRMDAALTSASGKRGISPFQFVLSQIDYTAFSYWSHPQITPKTSTHPYHYKGVPVVEAEEPTSGSYLHFRQPLAAQNPGPVSI